MISTNIFLRLATAAILGATVVGSQFIEKADLKARSTNSAQAQIDSSGEELSASLELVRHSPSIGFRNVVANTVFIQFLQYFGDDDARKQFGYAKSPDFFEALISQDPYYRDFYIFLSGSSTLYAGRPDRSVEITASGLSNLSPNQPPDSYYVWRYKAVDELLFLGDNKAAQASFGTAADWAAQSKAPGSEQIAIQSRRTADFLADNPNSRVAQIDAWSSLLTTALDKDTRIRAIKKIEELGGSIVISEDGSLGVQYEKAEDSESANNSDI